MSIYLSLYIFLFSLFTKTYAIVVCRSERDKYVGFFSIFLVLSLLLSTNISDGLACMLTSLFFFSLIFLFVTHPSASFYCCQIMAKKHLCAENRSNTSNWKGKTRTFAKREKEKKKAIRLWRPTCNTIRTKQFFSFSPKWEKKRGSQLLS
jgi:hypothetical protein